MKSMEIKRVGSKQRIQGEFQIGNFKERAENFVLKKRKKKYGKQPHQPTRIKCSFLSLNFDDFSFLSLQNQKGFKIRVNKSNGVALKTIEDQKKKEKRRVGFESYDKCSQFNV